MGSTWALCYVTSATFQGTCSGRKRRAINFDGASVDESEFKPSQLKEDVQSSREDGSLDREGRFLLYWITTTSISTSTSFTTTFTISSALCTAPRIQYLWIDKKTTKVVSQML